LKEKGRGFAMSPELFALSLSPCPDLSLTERRCTGKDNSFNRMAAGA